ncbi:MAG: hypothetical protein R2867_34920 [Caldilineaceae bacterium]
MNIRFGHRTLPYPSSDLTELRDSNLLLGDRSALQQRMTEDGYLLLRGLIDRKKVLQARRTVLEHMAAQAALTPGTPVLEGVMPQGDAACP